MSIESELQLRSDSACELCGQDNHLSTFPVPPKASESADHCIYVCKTCQHQIENPDDRDPNHWRCLNDSMWSTHPPVQVMAWRMLSALREHSWPQDLLDMLYLDKETMEWATAINESVPVEAMVIHKDINGAILGSGDSVVLTKDLNVKGANFTAKRGTTIRNISLVHDNAEQIEGKINGQQIVILTKFVKK